jgi:hypothetical protein
MVMQHNKATLRSSLSNKILIKHVMTIRSSNCNLFYLKDIKSFEKLITTEVRKAIEICILVDWVLGIWFKLNLKSPYYNEEVMYALG